MTRIIQEERNWERNIKECTVAARLPDTWLHLPVYGCSDNGQFCYISPQINHNRISYRDGCLNAHFIILEIQGFKVSGYTYMDLEELIQSLTINSEPIIIKTVSNHFLPPTIKEYLCQIFPANSFDQDLQGVIRDNVYLRVVPCTTRKPRLGEINGIDYQFLTIDEFLELDKNNGMLESGIFEGNYYGTPKPSNHCPRMANAGSVDDNPSLPSSTDVEEWELGPLPDQWEMGFTEDNYRYFIDHNTGTTQWNDPRLPEEVNGDEEQAPNLEDLNLDEYLPYGWEKVYDQKYGVFYIDHNNKRTQYEAPDPDAYRVNARSPDRRSITSSASNLALSSSQFTRDPSMLMGSIARTTLIKSPRGFGFTIIGGSDRRKPEFLQIKHVMVGGPASVDGLLETGDVLVYVGNCLVLGFMHADIVALFQKIVIGQQVTMTVCKGYPMPYDINDPCSQVVTTMAVEDVPMQVSQQSVVDQHSYLPTPSVQSEGSLSSAKSSQSTGGSNSDITNANVKFFAKNTQPEFIKVNILKCCTGFGFTISDNARGQRVKQILDHSRCGRLKEGDILVEINTTRVKEKSHQDVVQILKDCPEGLEVALLVQRGGISTQSSNSSGYSSCTRLQASVASSTPPLLPIKTSANTPSGMDTATNLPNTSYHGPISSTNILSQSLLESHDVGDRRDLSDLAVANYLCQQPSEDTNQSAGTQKARSRTPGPDNGARKLLYQDPSMATTNHDLCCVGPHQLEYDSMSRRPKTPTAAEMRTTAYWDPFSGQSPDFVPVSVLLSNSEIMAISNSIAQSDCRATDIPTYGSLARLQPHRNSVPFPTQPTPVTEIDDIVSGVFFITLNKLINGFGFRIIGGAEDNSAITIGPLVPEGAAEQCGQIKHGDELMSVNGATVIGASHKKVVQLVAAASRLGSVTLGLRRPGYQTIGPNRRVAFDVTLTRSDTLGFGFVIVTSVTRAGTHVGEFIGKVIDNSPAQQCGQLRVDDRILAVNGVSVTKMRHEKIVQTIKNCGRTVTLRIFPSGVDGADVRIGTGSITSQESSDPGTSSRSSTMSGDDFEIMLTRGSNGFGFSIRGGQDFNKMPLFVLKIAEDGPAKADGRLRVGDKILQINGKSTTGMTHSQAIGVIQAGGHLIRLLARRSHTIPRLPTQQESVPFHSPSRPSYDNSSPNRRPVIPPQYHDYDSAHRRQQLSSQTHS